MIRKSVSTSYSLQTNKPRVEELLTLFGNHYLSLAIQQMDIQHASISDPVSDMIRIILGDRLLSGESSVDLSSNNATNDGTENVRDGE